MCKKLGESRQSVAMLEFLEFIFDQGLMDIPLVGGSFIWSDNRELQSWSRSDRFLLSLEWEERYPDFLEETP